MRNYELSIELTTGEAEVERVEARGIVEAAFLLGANFGMAAALSSPAYPAGAKLLGVDGVAEAFMEATRQGITWIDWEVI